ncbi:MAG: hypothetical protein PHR56_05490 [Dehalococcoidales bacterium]|nr:hypothetical protein [Dehalococcoidales bacterium]
MSRFAKFSLVLCLFVIISTLGIGCSKPAAPTTTAPTTTTPAQTVTWKMQMWTEPSPQFGHFKRNSATAAALNWMDWVEAVSDGRIDIDRVAAGSVVPTGELLNAVKDNVLDVAFTSVNYFSGAIPETNIEYGVPGGPADIVEMYDWLYNWGLQAEFQQVYAAMGIQSWANPTNVLLSIGASFSMDNLASLKGKKLRAAGITADWAQALGAVPINMPYADVYQGMKLKTIDGWISGLVALEETKLKEVTPYFLTDPITMDCTNNCFINMKSLGEVPADLQRIIKMDSQYVLYATQTGYMEVGYQIANTPETKFQQWNDADKAAVSKLVVEKVWPAMAAKGGKCAKLMEMTGDWLKAYGRIK